MTEKTKGQVLNEALVAMGIITVGVLGMVGFLSRAIGQGKYIADQTAAVNLAAEGIEVAKNILDGNAVQGRPWNSGFNIAGYYEVDYTSETMGGLVSATDNENVLRYLSLATYNNANFYRYGGGGTVTGFKRSVRIQQISDSQIRATAKVYWRARGDLLREVSLVSDMYYWR
jgi:hypothetical protein